MDLSLKPKLANYVLKKYEPKLGSYFFYNAKTKKLWQTDFPTGSVVSALDSSLSFREIIDIILTNNPNLSKEETTKLFIDIFEFLFKEEFIIG